MNDIGNRLQKAREEKSLSINEIGDILFIRPKYLTALEENNQEIFNSIAQRAGFLKTYRDFLSVSSIEPDHKIDELPKELPTQEKPSPPQPIIQNPSPYERTDEIFRDIGSSIKERRDILGLSLEDVEQYTHIPPQYARMIEDGKFDDFSSPVQAQGMLGNYIDFLEMNQDAVMLHYAEGLQAKLAFRQQLESEKKSLPDKSKRRFEFPKVPRWIKTILSPDTIVFGILGITIFIGTIWGISRVMTTSASIIPNPTAPSLSDILIPTTTQSPTPSPTLPPSATPANFDPDATIEVTVPIFSQVGIQIFVIVHQRTYLRIIIDDVVAFDGRVVPGANLPFTAQNSITLLTGNSAAIDVFYNDQELAQFGLYGEVANVVFTRDGVITPTAQPSPTIDPAELVTPTITPTPPIDLPIEENPPVP